MTHMATNSVGKTINNLKTYNDFVDKENNPGSKKSKKKSVVGTSSNINSKKSRTRSKNPVIESLLASQFTLLSCPQNSETDASRLQDVTERDKPAASKDSERSSEEHSKKHDRRKQKRQKPVNSDCNQQQATHERCQTLEKNYTNSQSTHLQSNDDRNIEITTASDHQQPMNSMPQQRLHHRPLHFDNRGLVPPYPGDNIPSVDPSVLLYQHNFHAQFYQNSLLPSQPHYPLLSGDHRQLQSVYHHQYPVHPVYTSLEHHAPAIHAANLPPTCPSNAGVYVPAHYGAYPGCIPNGGGGIYAPGIGPNTPNLPFLASGAQYPMGGIPPPNGPTLMHHNMPMLHHNTARQQLEQLQQHPSEHNYTPMLPCTGIRHPNHQQQMQDIPSQLSNLFIDQASSYNSGSSSSVLQENNSNGRNHLSLQNKRNDKFRLGKENDSKENMHKEARKSIYSRTDDKNANYPIQNYIFRNINSMCSITPPQSPHNVENDDYQSSEKADTFDDVSSVNSSARKKHNVHQHHHHHHHKHHNHHRPDGKIGRNDHGRNSDDTMCERSSISSYSDSVKSFKSQGHSNKPKLSNDRMCASKVMVDSLQSHRNQNGDTKSSETSDMDDTSSKRLARVAAALSLLPIQDTPGEYEHRYAADISGKNALVPLKGKFPAASNERAFDVEVKKSMLEGLASRRKANKPPQLVLARQVSFFNRPF